EVRASRGESQELGAAVTPRPDSEADRLAVARGGVEKAGAAVEGRSTVGLDPAASGETGARGEPATGRDSEEAGESPAGEESSADTEKGSGAWTLSLTLVRFGREGDLSAVAPSTPRATKNRAERVDTPRSGLTEWYVNDERGLEQ